MRLVVSPFEQDNFGVQPCYHITKERIKKYYPLDLLAMCGEIGIGMEDLVAEIEQVLQNQMEREVSSAQIGELVMERLKKVDEVSYVRFASVYRQFKDINTFMTELNKLLEDK